MKICLITYDSTNDERNNFKIVNKLFKIHLLFNNNITIY